MTTSPLFELHIAPMFRALDREHMLSRFDLWSYDAVVANAQVILTRLEADMPTPASGGPWPHEWVNLFKRWVESGCKRLELGTAQLARAQSGSMMIVTATGTFPAPGYRGWLQLESETPNARNYVLYFDPPDAPTSGTPAPFSLRERYAASDTRAVFVRDATGTHEVALTPPAPASAALAAAEDRDFFDV